MAVDNDTCRHELQHLMDIVVQESEQKGLIFTIAKCYTMVFSKGSSMPICQIKVHRKPLEQVNSSVYIGSVFTSDGGCEKEVKRRIGIANIYSVHIYEESIVREK